MLQITSQLKNWRFEMIISPIWDDISSFNFTDGSTLISSLGIRKKLKLLNLTKLLTVKKWLKSYLLPCNLLDVTPLFNSPAIVYTVTFIFKILGEYTRTKRNLHLHQRSDDIHRNHISLWSMSRSHIHHNHIYLE